MAHVYGHVDFLKIWFSKTNRKMLDAMANHAVRIREFMDRYGQDRVESFIDHCLALENLIDPYLPFSQPPSRSGKDEGSVAEGSQEPGRLKVNRGYMDKFINPPEFLEEQRKKLEGQAIKSKKNPPDPQKDVLLFLLQNAPLEDWEYEVLSIVRDEAYYFAPQGQTKIMNEGWASYWHSKIMTEKALKDSEVIDFCDTLLDAGDGARRSSDRLASNFIATRRALDRGKIRQNTTSATIWARQVGQEARLVERRFSKCVASQHVTFNTVSDENSVNPEALHFTVHRLTTARNR